MLLWLLREIIDKDCYYYSKVCFLKLLSIRIGKKGRGYYLKDAYTSSLTGADKVTHESFTWQ